MTTWSGWAAYFLAAASLPDTANNVKFLNEWAANATAPGCQNNPIDLTHKITGQSSNCHATGQVGVNIQRYSSHLWARTAFDAEIHDGSHNVILAALRSGNPYKVTNPGQLATALGNWGSTKFGNVYLHDVQAGTPPKVAPKSLTGWNDVQRSVNVNLPRTLRESNRYTVRALQALARARKVRL